MGILDELTSVTKDKNSNEELVQRCLKIPALLHSIAEGLRTGTPNAKVDCAQILVDVAQCKPDLLGDFVNDFLDASRSPNKRIAKFGFTGLGIVAHANPAEVFAERDYLFNTCRQGGSLALPAATVIAELCRNNANYRGKLLGGLLRMIPSVEEKALPKWIKAIGPAIEGSNESLKKLLMTIEPLRATWSEDSCKRIDKLLTKLSRATAKKKR